MERFRLDARNPRPLCLYWHAVTTVRQAELDRESIAADLFRRQIDGVLRHRKVVSLDDLVERLGRGEELDPRSVVLTFDDALRCQAANAFPILEEHELPFALSVPTESVATGRPIWCSTLTYVVFRTRAPKISFSGLEFDVPPSPADRDAVHSAIRKSLFGMRHVELVAASGEIFAQAAAEREAASRHPTFRPMSFREVAALKRCTLVAHSHRHFPFNRLETREELAAEIGESKDRIEKATGREVKFFALPYGYHARDREGQSAELKARGIEACLTSDWRPIDVRHDLFYLPRVNAQQCL